MSQLWEQVCKTVNFIVKSFTRILIIARSSGNFAQVCSYFFPPKKAKESEGRKNESIMGNGI